MSFSPRFSLFTTKEKKQEKSPDFTGNIEILKSELAELVEHLRSQEGETNYKDEVVVKLRISGWESTSKNGLGYISGLVSEALPPREEAPAPASSAAPSDFDGVPF